MDKTSNNARLEDLIADDGGHFDWREYFHAIRDRLWIVILCLVLGAIGAALYLSRLETLYRARSVLFIEQTESRVLSGMQSVRDESIRSIDMINTIVDLLRSYPYAQRVATRLKLGENPAFLRAVQSDEAQLSPDAAAGALMGIMSAGYREETRLIDIFATSRDPAIATLLANAYAEEYPFYVGDRRLDAIRSANQFLIDEAERLRSKMRTSEEAIQSFRERERAASLEIMLEQSQTQLTASTVAARQLEENLAQLQKDLAAAQSIRNDPAALLGLPSVANEPKVAQLTASIIAQEQELNLITQRYLPGHPVYAAAKKRLELLTAAREENLQDVVSLLESGRARMEAQLAEVQKEKKSSEARLLETTGKSVEYNTLTRELESDKALYQSVLERMKEVDITKGLNDTPVTIRERALGAGPIRTNLLQVWGLAIAGGLFGGIGIALGLHFLDTSVKTVDQVERWTGLNVVAAVPRIKKLSKQTAPGELITVKERNSPVAEAFRTLRAAVALLSGREQRQVFLFTSALPSEGKTFSSSNFAATLAQQGFRTLYIDSDLRKPEVSRIFYGEHVKPGLSEILLEQVTLKDAVRPSGIPNLTVLTAGGRSRNPSELLATRHLRELVDLARKEYDRIVIDSAPVIAVSDSLLVAETADVCCLVVRALSTPKSTILRAIRLLTDVGRRPTGTVLNFLPSDRGGYYYYYSGRYHGAYGGKNVYADEIPAESSGTPS